MSIVPSFVKKNHADLFRLGVIRALAPGIDFHESQTIPMNQCAYGNYTKLNYLIEKHYRKPSQRQRNACAEASRESNRGF